MKSKMGIIAIIAALGLLLITGSVTAEGPASVESQAIVGSAFTYQGHLKANGSLINGNCDMTFGLYDQLTNGNQIGDAISKTVPVTKGLFTVSLDFGSSAFNGQARYLQIGVKCGSDSEFTTLSPRQELTAAPYALYALNNVPLSGGTMTGDLTTTRLNAGSPTNPSCNGNGDVCAQDDIVADDDVTQSRTGDGTVKAAVYALCNNPVSTMRRYFNNVNGAEITISNGPSLGICTIDFGFQVDDRYIVAAATHPDTQLGVTVFTASGNTAQFFVWHAAANGAAAGGDIYVIVY